MADQRKKPFACWEANFSTGPGGPTLQELLRMAFADTMSSDRLWPLQETPGLVALPYYSLINELFPKGKSLCGHFLKYSGEQVASALKLAPNASKLDITKFELPDSDDGRPQRLLTGNLYFACHRNHIALAQSQNLRASHLEKYLHEMFYVRCPTHMNNQRVRLKRALSRTKYKELSGVTSIRITEPIDIRDEISDLFSDDNRQSDRKITASRFIASIKSLTDQDVDDYADEFSKAFEPQNIDLSIDVTWKRYRGQNVSDQMDAIANALRFLDQEINIEYKTSEGWIHHSDLTLGTEKYVLYDGGMPVSNDIFEKLVEWLLSIMKDL